jgi:hypothetical protein
VSNRAPEGARCGAFLIKMDPLVISRGVGKLVNALLANRQRLGGAELLPDGVEQIFGVIENTLGHKRRLQEIGGTA